MKIEKPEEAEDSARIEALIVEDLEKIEALRVGINFLKFKNKAEILSISSELL